MISTGLRYFLQVARSGSIAQAAQKLHVASSAVSRQIAKLEDGLGVALFERQPRGMVLSDAGRQLAAYASAAALEAERVATELRSRGALGDVTVRIACTEGFAHRLLPMAMARFKQRHAEVRFHMHVDHAQGVGQRLSEGISQVGIRYSLVPDRRLQAEALYRAPVYAIVCRQHPLAPSRSIDVSQLREYPLALGDTDTTVRQLFDACCANAGLHIEPAYVTNHSAAFLPLLPGSPIVALSGYLTVQDQLQADGLVAVPFSNPEMHQRSIQVLTLQGHVLPPMAATFTAYIKETLAQLAPPALRGSAVRRY